MENTYQCFSVDFYFFNTLCGLFPFKEEKQTVYSFENQIFKAKGELVLMKQSHHYYLVNITFKLTSHFRNKDLK